jgi:hypothetical protein
MMLHFDLAFHSRFNVFSVQTHQIHVRALVCFPCHVFGGVTVPDFPADASLLT